MECRTQVLIVGGGAAGLTASMLLSQAGINALLVERHPGTSILPKAHVLNAPTMEVFSELGIADAIYARGTPRENMARSAWFTSLTGPTPLHGRKIGEMSSFGAGALIERYEAASPCRVTNLPQIRLEPIMRRQAETFAPGRVRFHHELKSFRQDAHGVLAEVLDRDGGDTYTVRADYLIGADGGRCIGPALGIEMVGDKNLVSMVSAHISADLSRWADDHTLINFYINPDGTGSMGSGVLVKMGPTHWGRHSEEFVFHAAFMPDDPAQFDEPTMLKRMRDLLGIPDFNPTIHVISQWRVERTVASRLQDGRCFLIGDAAHRHPPTTGLGLNTAVGDAYSLCWKLAVVLKNQAARSLLDTHDVERHPVAEQVVDQALSTFFQHRDIDAAIGLAPGQKREQGWSQMARLFSEDADGAAVRTRVASTIENHLEFGALNVEVGYVYARGALVDDGSERKTGADPVRQYLADARPGHRLPHAWLLRGEERRSTFELCRQGFTLIVGADHHAWRDAVAAANSALGLDLRVLVIGAGGWIDVTGAWRRHRGTGEAGCVLVRPDARVAWRSVTSADATSRLDAALRAILGRAERQA